MSKQQQTLGKSFINAFAGWKYFVLNDRNGQIHTGFTCIAIVAGFLLHISAVEWMFIIGCIAMVTALEMLNSCLEKLCDMVQPNFHPTIKIIKDVSAAAVTIAAIASVIIGVIIFLPKILSLL